MELTLYNFSVVGEEDGDKLLLAELIVNVFIFGMGEDDAVLLCCHFFKQRDCQSVNQEIDGVDEYRKLLMVGVERQLGEFVGEDDEICDFVAFVDELVEVLLDEILVEAAEVGVAEEPF